MNNPLPEWSEDNPQSGCDGATHAVFNQAADPVGYNAFDDDVALSSITERFAPWAAGHASRLGALAGTAQAQDAARLANLYTPVLKNFDRYGNRLDWVEFHPAWHQLMSWAFGNQVHSLAWTATEPNGHFARAVQSYLWNQIENGVGCPTGMAYASVAGFRRYPELAAWKEKTLQTQYDPRRLPIEQKTHAVIAYAMTEKQGGSDLRETQTFAVPHENGEHGAIYLVTGHKWFCSVPVADGIYTLARTQAGVSCFFMPRILPDGTTNRIFIQRLKDKAGNKSNASSEIEYRNAWAILVGEEGRGIREILSHAHLTRLDFAVGSAGLMRHALTLALNHAQTRTAFGKPLAEQPIQEAVLADLAIDAEASMLMALRVSRATDGWEAGNAAEKALARIATPVAKFWNCRRAASFVVEALEVHGGNGFIEENPMARLYREAPLNAIWEGTSNMMCMDVMRAMKREPQTLDALLDDFAGLAGANRFFDAHLGVLKATLDEGAEIEGNARRIASLMALALQGAELLRHSTAEVADAFCASRLHDGMGYVFGVLKPTPALRHIVRRAAVVPH
ncbi:MULTISPECIES: acyl-CoA dehydrogenase family protein [unclassified Burkholderia]|uniref:acyl-CoA dehydrogenase family protein n=1 Tax=unclassified Burkholderia TaxID=2613784 RepID=UPI00075EC980|nr:MULTISPECIES: acyl-CoA dehydrogenase family protein [unclassified Burkholderia]KVN07339.1 acyl-CoA dehydrogenase [Burkholderia sp. MSMB1552]KWZ51706.1 acyl-CoA dehydrogenase [Burkholderia sp. MSMB1588]